MELLLDHDANLTHLTLSSIIKLAIIEHHLSVVNELLDLTVLVLLQLLLYRAEIHWLLHDLVVVRDLQGIHVHRLRENIGFWISLQSQK